MNHSLTGAFSGRIRTAPEGVGSTRRGLTHSLEFSKEGLAVNATRTIDLDTIDLAYVESRISAPDSRGCRVWSGSRGRNGYGYVSRGRKLARLLAHRVVYTWRVGPIPEGLVIDHLCRNRACVAIGHLEPVTIAENNRRGFGASGIHGRQTHCVHGHAFTDSNTYRTPEGKRRCRTCDRAANLTRPSGWQRQRERAAEGKTA